MLKIRRFIIKSISNNKYSFNKIKVIESNYMIDAWRVNFSHIVEIEVKNWFYYISFYRFFFFLPKLN